MSRRQAVEGGADLSVSNVGGIDETSVSFTPGITILSGRNTTNRTSLLQGIMAAMGSENVSLKGDADRGQVELDFDGETYTRTLSRENGRITTGGDPYLDDPELADLFSFLLESNEARQSVTRKEDLRELIMRPVDTHAIQSEIDDLTEEKRQLDERLEELSTLEQRLPELAERQSEVESKIERKEAQLEERRSELEDADANLQDTREEKAEFDEKFDRLKDLRNERETVRRRLETQRNSIEALREEREQLEADLEELPEAPVGNVDEVESEIDRLRGQIRELETTISDLQTVIQFNEDMADESSPGMLSTLDEAGSANSADSLTGELVEPDSVVCWTCGSDVERDQIEETIDRIRDLRQAKVGTRRELEAEIEELRTEKIEYEEKQRQREQVQDRYEEVESEIDRREPKLEELEERSEGLGEEIAELETEIEEEDEDEFSEILSLHRKLNQIEFELDQLREEREDVDAEIERVEERLEERDELEARREEVQSELRDCRSRIETIEREAIEQFNEQMEIVLDLLDYQNLERIWIERVETETREGRRTVTTSVFELHIVRSTDSGRTYEDTIDHLSESEREVTGLVFALAGYLVHDVHEKVPFMLLDSLEAIDSDRLSTLVEHFEQYPDYLVAALLEEDAAAFDDEYPRLTDI